MKKVRFGTSNEEVAAVGLGLMRIQTAHNPVEVLNTAYENQIDFFDHADIYGRGECETIFADALEKSAVKRENIFIQSKCGLFLVKCIISLKSILYKRLKEVCTA